MGLSGPGGPQEKRWGPWLVALLRSGACWARQTPRWPPGGSVHGITLALSPPLGADIPDQAGNLAANPFQERICQVFSTAEDRDGSMSFEDFLDMLSVFSDSATSEIKSHYAFRIFDFDDDGTLDRKDLEQLVNCLTGEGEESRLSPSEMHQLLQNILEESDIDKDGTINLSEFQHVISRSPDFASSFKIVL
uniref:Calcium and integrin binding 1 n=1 Tax=Sphenodon punctatus TaxID=8508 RepID=A0A8D0G9V7_SPHPU